MLFRSLRASGAEGLGNISIDEEVGRLENAMLDQDPVTKMAGSHKTLSMSEETGQLLRILFG